MGRPYYSRIKKQWYEVTGHQGGSFKKYVLNDYLVEKIGGIDGQALLELGAGNGYFVPLLCKRFSAQIPSRIVIVVLRSEKQYMPILKQSGFEFEYDSLFPTTEVLNERPGLRFSKDVPLAMVFNCRKNG